MKCVVRLVLRMVKLRENLFDGFVLLKHFIFLNQLNGGKKCLVLEKGSREMRRIK